MKCLPPCRSLAANCQVLQGQDVRSTVLGKGNMGQREITVKGVFLPWPPAPAATELKIFPCLSRSLVLLHLNGTISALCTIPKLPLSHLANCFSKPC